MLIHHIEWNTLTHRNSIFKLNTAYQADTYPQKVNLGVGAYRDDNNKPWVLPVVKKVCMSYSLWLGWGSNAGMPQASQILLSDPSLHHEYLPILGLPEFISSAARLMLGKDSPAIAEGRVASVQTISGTGANHLAALFLSKYYPFNGDKVVYLSDPTWGTCLFLGPSANA
jgi:aspartate aminotransferase, cytoplasmic